MKPGLNYQSLRTQKARIAVAINSYGKYILYGLVILLLAMAIFTLWLEMPIAWSLVGLLFVPVVILIWYYKDLKLLPIIKDAKSIDDVLSGDVLGHLPKKASPAEIARTLSNLNGGHFFAFRFGVSPKFIQDIVSNDQSDSEKVWQSAINIYQETGSREITASVLVAALLENSIYSKELLNHLQLSIDDVKNGVRWHNHLLEMSGQKRFDFKTGGLARDWSFGWVPLLNRFARNISNDSPAGFDNFDQHTEAVDQIIGIMSRQGRQNAVLIGPSGVGKTEVVAQLARRLFVDRPDTPSSLKFQQIYVLDPAALIAAAPGKGELENLVPMILNEAASAKNIIICLDNAQLFFEEGVGSVDLGNILLPIIEAGGLRLILTMDEQSFLRISQSRPDLAGLLNRIKIDPADQTTTLKIMQHESVFVEYKNKVTFMYQALVEAHRLSDRYVQDLAMPGKAINLMESAARYAEGGLVTAKSVQRAIEETAGVRVGAVDSESERDNLLNMEELIHKRMVNQSRAVAAVSDALRRARAGVRNPNRPIGTFMFLGPTGVGKTELAKALADVYFGGEDKIIRVDMNEYVRADDVARLIADPSIDASSLTSQVSKQPFSVVLLDEIEKAHNNVLMTLLQMLDEGILRDSKNREISFKDAIIIATSNAGADRIREYIERGHDLEKFEDQFVDELISSGQFKPEFLNRFDEIAVFRPLNKQELLQVVDHIIDSINKTLSLQKINVSVDDEAKSYLVDAGYDPRLGARPMRRVVQKAVESLVAKQVLSKEVEAGQTVSITLEQVKAIVEVRRKADKMVEASSNETLE